MELSFCVNTNITNFNYQFIYCIHLSVLKLFFTSSGGGFLYTEANSFSLVVLFVPYGEKCLISKVFQFFWLAHF